MSEPDKTAENIKRIKLALADPAAPWYGSDLVSWVGDLLDDHEMLLLGREVSDE